MSRYIDADALLERSQANSLCVGIRNGKRLLTACKNYLWLYVNDAPTADVEPVVHGRWLTWEEQFPGEMPKKKSRLGVFCSACHNHADNMFDFCPNCGAKMDGERKDNKNG